MKMYACKRMGNYKTIGTSWHFTGINGFDAERCALKANKAEREVFLKAGFDLEKETEEFGSLWLNREEIIDLKDKLITLTNLGERDTRMVQATTQFMQVCLDQGYEIRFY